MITHQLVEKIFEIEKNIENIKQQKEKVDIILFDSSDDEDKVESKQQPSI